MNAFKSTILTLTASLFLFAANAEARIIGMIGDTEDRAEVLKIESLGYAGDILLKITFDGYTTPLSATASTGFVNFQGDVQFKQEDEDGSSALVLTLTQEPTFPPFFNYYTAPEELREQKKKEHDELVEKGDYNPRPQTQYMGLKAGLLATAIKSQYLNDAYEAIMSGDVKLVIAYQHMAEGDPDFSIKYFRFDLKTAVLGGVLYETGK